jgi:hypothetical protein
MTDAGASRTITSLITAGRSLLSASKMGIDIYAVWRGQTAEEEKAQVTGFSTVHGHVGYLREAYHGEPYATRHLCAEAFTTGEARMPAALLRERLPETLTLAERREREVYNETDEREIAAVLKSFTDFVALCEEKEDETGEPVTIVASY